MGRGTIGKRIARRAAIALAGLAAASALAPAGASAQLFSGAVIDSGPSGTVRTGSATFTFHSAALIPSFECKLDGGAFVSCTSPKSYSGLGDGTHVFQVRDVGLLGDPTPATRTWAVDTTPPDTSITGGPPALTNSTSLTYSFASSEAGSTFECRMDAGAFLPCSSPKTYTGLSEGSHTFSVRSVDVVGNVDQSPASRTVNIDLTPPNTSITSAPFGPTNKNTVVFQFAATEGGSFSCSLDGGAFTPCSSPASYSNLSDGTHTFAVRATDAAGNTDPSPATIAVLVDTTPPDTTITQAPPAATDSTVAEFGFTASEPSAFLCSIDNGQPTVCASPKGYQGLGPGDHAFLVSAVDPAGNVDPSPASAHWTTTATSTPGQCTSCGPGTTQPGPVTAVLQVSNRSPIAGRGVQFNASASRSTKGALLTYEFTYGDGTKELTNQPFTLHAYRRPGSYVATVKVVDVLGLSATSTGVRLVVDDGTPPKVAITSPKHGAILRLRSRGLIFRGTDADSSGVRRVQLALQVTQLARRASASAGCLWFDGKRKLRRRSCNRPLWFKASLRDRRWSYKLSGKAKLPRGSYALRVRATDLTGLTSNLLSVRARTIVALRLA